MAVNDGNSAENIDNVLAELHSYLHSEMSVGQPDEEKVDVTVLVRNNAPLRAEGGMVVFTGVGLHILDGSERADSHLKWTREIHQSRPSNQQNLRQSYQKGAWVTGEQFTAMTENEQTFGEILFPGESVVYEMQIPEEYLPYTEIKVEGTISRRHLFHISRTMSGLEQWTRPPLVETFKALSAIDIKRPIVAATDAMPNFGSKTTLEEINTFKDIVEEAKSLIQPTMQALNEVYHSAPNQEIRDHLKQNVGNYLTSLEKLFYSTLEALSSGNVEQMREAANSLTERLVASEEVKLQTQELMKQFGV